MCILPLGSLWQLSMMVDSIFLYLFLSSEPSGMYSWHHKWGPRFQSRHCHGASCLICPLLCFTLKVLERNKGCSPQGYLLPAILNGSPMSTTPALWMHHSQRTCNLTHSMIIVCSSIQSHPSFSHSSSFGTTVSLSQACVCLLCVVSSTQTTIRPIVRSYIEF